MLPTDTNQRNKHTKQQRRKDYLLGPVLLMWFNFNLSMDKYLQTL